MPRERGPRDEVPSPRNPSGSQLARPSVYADDDDVTFAHSDGDEAALGTADDGNDLLASPSTSRNPMGRPRTAFDYAEVERIVGIGNRMTDLAYILGVSKSCVEKRMQNDAHFKNAVERGRARKRNLLHTAQMRAALDGNPTMLIWRGKQDLGQRDYRALEVTGADGVPLAIGIDPGPILESKLVQFLQSRTNGDRPPLEVRDDDRGNGADTERDHDADE